MADDHAAEVHRTARLSRAELRAELEAEHRRRKERLGRLSPWVV